MHERVELYFSANSVAQDKKVATFLSVVGPTVYSTLWSIRTNITLTQAIEQALAMEAATKNAFFVNSHKHGIN